MPTEITLLAWSVVLLFVHLMVQGQTATRDRGVRWNAGPRDGAPPPLGTLAGRAARARSNYLESFPAFVGLALAVVVTGRSGGLAAAGAWLWFGARIVYLPLYLLGIPYLRSLVWLASAVGLILMLLRLL